MSKERNLILMRNKRWMSLLLCGIMLLTAGCTKEDAASSEPKETAATTVTTAETTETTLVTEETVPPDRDRTDVDVETEHILDDAGVLDAAVHDTLNVRAAWLAKTFRLRVCVVIADTLEGMKPADYAAHCFSELYPKENNGVLLLINNESGEDCLYTKGTAKQYMAGLSEMICARIAKDLAGGDYQTAVEYVFSQIELACPEHIFDECGALTAEEAKDLETQADQLTADGRPVFVILTDGTVSAEDAQKLLAEIAKDESAALLMINPNEEMIAAALSGELRDAVSNTALGAALDRTDAALKNTSVAAACVRFMDSVANFGA